MKKPTQVGYLKKCIKCDTIVAKVWENECNAFGFFRNSCKCEKLNERIKE